MLAGPRTQICFALLASLSPALCAAIDDPASQPAGVRPFIGLLLPLSSAEFATAAEAVRLGCLAALALSENRQPLQVVRTDAKPESILAEYEATVQRGAGVMVGPLTRSGVTVLAAAGRVSVPTLALNVADGDAPLPSQLYTFGLPAEPEARMTARIAYARGLRDAAVVLASSVLAKRVSRAFAEEWFSLGGKISDVRQFGAQIDLIGLRQRLADSEAQLVFLATDAREARRVRPYLNNQIPVYATSQVNDGTNDPLINGDLNGIRFVDMPWLVQPDHPAVMVYERRGGMSAVLQRLYALGIDSCRIADELLSGKRRISLDGVTGRVSYQGGNVIQREPVQAIFRDGVGLSVELAR